MDTSSNSPSRREFLRKTAVAGLGVAAVRDISGLSNEPGFVPPANPVVVASANGLEAVKKAYDDILAGAGTLDGVVAGVNIVEADPNDNSVGYGGIPNFEGVVQLDSAVMHGPTGRSGAVASIEGIMHPSKVAKLVLERTDHCLLVGDGAQKFALMHGFKVENLLTEETREIWVEWRENLSGKDDYLPPHSVGDKDIGWIDFEYQRDWGTIHCSAVDSNGDISSVTTTSGLSFKIPGRVGDSPIVGAGLYTDNEVGSAGSTGRGEANIENLASFLIVERMRAGDSPEDACLYTCERIAKHTMLARLLDDQGRPNFNVKFYAVNKSGQFGGAEIRNTGGKMSVADADGVRHVPLAALYG
jgi:N4-(beta-N-acetylglucosaminyl)-L-asparaginase